MPKSCSARGCSNHHMMKEKKVSFYRFPNAIKRPDRRSQWISACQRLNPDGSKWLPISKYVYICSEHFVTGRPVDEPSHVDYVPTVFSSTRQSTNSSGSQSKKRRKPSRTSGMKPQEKLKDATYEAAEILISLAMMNDSGTSSPSPPSVDQNDSKSALNVY